MYFCHIFGLSKLLTGRENGSQKGITEWEFGPQNHLQNKKILTGHDFSYLQNL